MRTIRPILRSTARGLSVLLVAAAAGCGRPDAKEDRRADGAGKDPRPQTPATRPVDLVGGAVFADPADPARPSDLPADLTGAPERLYGSWVSVHPVDAKLGAVDIRVKFVEDGPARITAWSTLPFVGKVRETSGPYEVDGDTITSEAIHGGTSVKFHFEGEELVIRYADGKRVRFRRP